MTFPAHSSRRALAPSAGLALAGALWATLPACGKGSDAATGTTGGTPSSTAATSSSSTTTATTATTTGAGGHGGAGGAGGGMGGGGVGGGGVGGVGGGAGGAGGLFVPTPADIQFQPVSPLPAGEQIVFNDWGPSPNTLVAMTPAGASPTVLFKVYRLWSMGVSHAADRIAFSCGDPQQKAHYGIDVGDAIQHTWLYDVAGQTITLLSDGNLNDECHTFGPGDKQLYVCRRYDFQKDGTSKGYRLGKTDLGTSAFDFLTPDDPNRLALYPQPTAAETELYFTTIAVQGASQVREIDTMPLPAAAATLLRKKADHAVLSPDGTRYLYSDYADGGALHAANLDGSGDLRVVNAHADEAKYSPDGARAVYLSYDGVAGCSHIDVAKVDGTEAAKPTRIRDCVKTHEFITQVSWVAH